MNDLESLLRGLIREEVRSALEEMLPQLRSQPATQPLQTDESLLLSTRDAAKRLAISERTLFSLTKSGQLPCVRLGMAKRYSVETIKQWIQKSEAEPASPPDSPPRKPASSPDAQSLIRPKSVKRIAKKAPKKQEKRISNMSASISSKPTAQQKPEQEDLNPLKLLLTEIGLEWDVLSTLPHGELLRVAEVDIPTFHGWRYLGRSMPVEAIEKLREYFRQFRKLE